MNRRELILASAILTSGAGAAWSREPLAPQPEAEEAGLRAWLERWLAAFNAGDARVYRDFVEAHAPTVVPYLDDDLGLQETTGGFDLLGYEITAGGEIRARVKDRNWDRFSTVTLTAGGAGILDDIAFSAAQPPEGFAVGRTSETDALSTLADKLRTETAAGRFSGSVRVARNGPALFERAGGMADVARGEEANPSTRYCIGSMGKMFTAVAVMQLVERGRIRLTDTLGTHLPSYRNRDLASRVTIEQLLTHTGGTGDIFGPDYDARKDSLRTPMDLVRFYGDRSPAFEPGSRWGYSNYGFILLGAVVEQVTATPWDVWFAEHVFRPAGMSATSQTFSAPQATARPYTGSNQTGLKPLTPYEGLPAGGGYSTAGDLLAFVDGLQNGVLVSADTLTAITTPRVQAGSRQWGLGFTIGRRHGAFYYGHAGSAPGVSGDLAVYPASGYRTVVLCNRGHPAAVNVAEFIGARLPEQAPVGQEAGES